MSTQKFNPANRPRCVNVYWRKGRRVRILSCPFGYQGKLATIGSVGEKYVYVRVYLGKKPGQHDEVAYPPECLRLV
jgi:hypothetical protein